ncbi:MAG: hypothetical protein WBD07_03680 [Vicinamibacterales bacterium]
MVSWYRVFVVSASLGVLCSAPLVAQRGGQAPAPDPKAQAAATAARNVEIQGTVKLADDAAAGLTAPNDFALTWMREDFMKAGPNSQYVPFIVTVDASKITNGPVTFYWRVVSKTAPSAPAAPATPPATGAAPARPKYAYEDINFVSQIDVAPAGAPTRIARSFSVPAGAYDVYVAIKEPVSAQRNAPPPKAAVVKHTITVPDFWSTELTTSSVIVGPLVPLTAPLTPQQAAERPYALGPVEIIPVADTNFTKRSALSLFMLIYNAKADAANKPDVSVEYVFCQAAPGTEAKEGDLCKAGEKFFNKTNPQNLNAQSLPPEFSLAAGHQVQTGQEVPLASFPEGSYRLEVKITDKLATKSLTRDINFTVMP